MAPRSDALDPRTPVLIGGGQISNRVDQGAEALEPVDLLAEAARRAAADTGADAGSVLAALDTIGVISVISWRYRDPATLVAARIGASPRRRWLTPDGGNFPQTLVNRAATDIATGQADLVLIGGGEAWRTRMAAGKGGTKPDWTREDESAAPTERIGEDHPLSHPHEVSRGVLMPVQHYPLFESVLRARAGRSHDEHRQHLARLWAGFAAVAADNPHAWIRDAPSAERLATVDDGNRMVGFPYPKLLNSNNAVEQGAAVIVASVEKARALGVPPERWVFPQAGTDAHDTWYVSHRPDLGGSPAIRAAGRRVLELAGTGADDLAHIDVYSCFPSAVQVAANELGLAMDRPLTITGGLTFAGGPWNNYVSHSIATLVDRLRAEPGTTGLITANGGYLTKHAFGVYRTEPPPSGAFAWEDCQAAADKAGSVELCEAYDGPVRVEAYTVMHGREGEPERAVATVRLDDGRRAWGATDDADSLARLEQEEGVGLPATLASDGTLSL